VSGPAATSWVVPGSGGERVKTAGKAEMTRSEGLRRLQAHLESAQEELLGASGLELAEEAASDEFIAERIRLVLAEIGQLSRLVAWKRRASPESK
jgi:hypothetical protein